MDRMAHSPIPVQLQVMAVMLLLPAILTPTPLFLMVQPTNLLLAEVLWMHMLLNLIRPDKYSGEPITVEAEMKPDTVLQVMEQMYLLQERQAPVQILPPPAPGKELLPELF